MKFLKWLLIGLVTLVLVVGIGIAALVYLVDWNDYKETIQNQTKKHTGRDLIITGDLNPSVFPWAGISVGEISLANAEGFGEQPFAQIASADVKVELLPLLRKVVNIRKVELKGLNLDLQRAADGSTNWDDLLNRTSTTTTTSGDDKTTEVEVEGGTAAIAALEVGGIEISDANVMWNDATTGADVALAHFNLHTGGIELAKPFELATDFSVSSNSMDLNASVKGRGEVMLDLDQQVYSLSGFKLETDAKGGALPNGALLASVGADITAKLVEQTINIDSLSLDALGLQLAGDVTVENLDTEAAVSGQLSSNEFSPRELLAKLGIAEPETADPGVLQKASLSLVLSATPSSAALNDLTIKLDDTAFTGSASVPSLAGDIPPVRFSFAVDAIDLDRYLPPKAAVGDDTATATPTAEAGSSAAGGDTPIELPMDMLRQLDIDGEFKVGSVKVSNLTTKNIVVPVSAKNGRISIDGLQASLYEGQLTSTAVLDATQALPGYTIKMGLTGIQADPLLADLLQKDSFLSGKGEFSADLSTSGESVNALTSGLNGQFNTAFNDGSINGINIGYQIRRAKAALTGQSLSADEKQVKTDFSTFSVGGTFTNGVMSSDNLDMRSPLLRIGGAGTVDLPGERVDYTLTTLITGTAQGQGGKDLAALKGVKLNVPIQGTFAELSEDFAGVVLAGMKANISDNLAGAAKAKAKEAADKLKAEAQAKLDAKEAELRKQADAAQAKAEEKLELQKQEAQKKLDEAAANVGDELKGKLKGLFK